MALPDNNIFENFQFYQLLTGTKHEITKYSILTQPLIMGDLKNDKLDL